MGPSATRSSHRNGWLRVNEAARDLGVSLNTLRRWSDSGKLTCYRSPGGHRRFRLEDVQALLVAEERPPTAEARRGRDRLTLSELRRRVADLNAIVDAGLEGTGGHSVDDVLRVVARRLADATNSPVADIYAVEDGTIRALVSYDNGAYDPSWEGKTFRIVDYPATRQAIESLQVRVVASLDDPVLTPEVRASLASWGYQSQLSLPLVAHDEVIGLAELSDTVPRDYADDLELIRGLAEVAARAIDNARLFEQVEHRNAVLRELVDIGTLVSRSRDVDELLRSVAQRLLTTLDAFDCDIYKIQDEGVFTCLVSVDRSGYDESVVGKALRLDLYPLAAEAVRRGEAVVVRDRTDARLTAEDLAVYDEYGFASELCVPLVVDGRTVGVIEIYGDRPRDFAQYLDFMKSAALVIGGAMEKALLYRLGERRSNVLKALVDLGALTAQCPDVEAFVREVTRRLTVTIEAADCDVYLPEDGGQLRCRASYHRDHGFDEAWAGTVLDTEEYPLTAQLARAGQVLVISNPDDPRLNTTERVAFARHGFVSELCIPLIAGERLIGLIDVFDDRERDFAEYFNFMTSAGQMVAGALENRFLLEQVSDRNRELLESARRREEEARRVSSLLDTSRAISSTLVLEDVLQLVATRAGELLGAGACYIYERDEQAEAFRWRCEYERDDAYAGGADIGTAYPYATWPEYDLLLMSPVIERHRSDAQLDEGTRAEMDEWHEATLVSVPLRFGDELVGLMEIAEHGTERRFSPEELDMARAFGEQAAVAIRNAQLYRHQESQTLRLASLLDASRAITSAVGLDESLAVVAQEAVAGLGCSESVIYEVDWQRREEVARAFFSAQGEEYENLGKRFPLDEWPSDVAVLARGEIIEESLSDPAIHPCGRASMERWGEKTSLNVPLYFAGQPVGIMELIELENERHFTPPEIEVVTALGEQAAIAIHNGKLIESLRETNRDLQAASSDSRC